MKRQLKQQHIAQELAKRLAANVDTFTPEAVAGEHLKQLAYIRSTARYVFACCSRQAGKTHGNMALLALTALATPNVACIYIGISTDQVRRTAWRKIWKPMLAKFNLQQTSTEDMTTTFANGSTVIFRSLDDERHVSTFLGDSLASGICIIDECQDASSDLLETVERAIEPCLINTSPEKPIPGRLIWSGTFPETPTGRYWDIYKNGSDSSYEKHTWCMFDNPHNPGASKELNSVLARLGITDQEPFIQREYFGNPIYDAKVTAYGFNPNKNFYQHITPVWESTLSLPPFVIKAAIPVDCTTYVIGIDPAGTTDRYAIEVWGWGPESPNVYQVFEAITAKGANPLQSQANAVVAAISRFYTGVAGIVRDHGSAAVTDDTLLYEYGIGNIEPAVKAELKARVDRFRDLLGTGRALVMRGTALAEDLALSRWDLRARERGQWRWHSSHHPDAADAANYAIGKYISLYKPDPQPAIEGIGEAMQRRAREAFTNPNRNIQYGPPADNFGGHVNTSTDYGGPPRNN